MDGMSRACLLALTITRPDSIEPLVPQINTAKERGFDLEVLPKANTRGSKPDHIDSQELWAIPL